MASWLDHFESIGENCEIGFVQRDLGHHSSSLLRWAMLDGVGPLAEGVQSGFEGTFAYENLAPSADTMVRDASAGVAFHTEMRSVMRDGVWEFTTPEEQRREIHAREWRKFKYLRSRFRHDLLTGDRIYIVKRNSGLSEQDAEVLLDAIASWGSGRLLYVTLADETHPAGSVEQIDPRVVRGRVDRFAPLSHADQVSLAAWELVLRGAAACFGLDGSPRRPALAQMAPMAASAIDSDPSQPCARAPERPDRFAKTYAALTDALADAVEGQKERSALNARLEQASQQLDHARLERAHLAARVAEATAHAAASDQHVQALQQTAIRQDRLIQVLRGKARDIAGLHATALDERAGLVQLARWVVRRPVTLGLLRRTPEARLAAIRDHAAALGVGPALDEDALLWVARRRTLIGLLRRTSAFAEAIVVEAFVRPAEAVRVHITQGLASKT